ncbi:MAG: ankyrin repeat domain-containing protein [Bacteroidota bacterium]
MTPVEKFFAAVKEGDLKELKELLSLQPDLATIRSEGATALHFAVIHNHRDIVDLLLTNGANPEAVDDEFEATPIGWANEAGHTEMVNYLYERGTHVGFFQAAAFGLTERIRQLIDENISEINILQGYGTPLHAAALWAHPLIVQILLNHDADPAMRNMYGMTALEIAQQQVSSNGDATPLVNAGRRKEIVDDCKLIVEILDDWLKKTSEESK